MMTPAWARSGRNRGITDLANAGVHGGAAGENDVGVKILADVHVALHDGLEGAVVDAGGLLADEGGLEEDLRAAESLVTDDDNIAIWEFVCA